MLCEAHLLPGALIRNTDCRFICKTSRLRVENADTPFTSAYKPGQTLRVPIAHGEGRYVCDEMTLADLRDNNRILFRYVDTTDAANEGRQPERLARRHRRYRQRRLQRSGHDAPPRTRLRKNPRLGRRRGIFESVIRAAQAILK